VPQTQALPVYDLGQQGILPDRTHRQNELRRLAAVMMGPNLGGDRFGKMAVERIQVWQDEQAIASLGAHFRGRHLQ
jgi:hypothetical protein